MLRPRLQGIHRFPLIPLPCCTVRHMHSLRTQTDSDSACSSQRPCAEDTLAAGQHCKSVEGVEYAK